MSGVRFWMAAHSARRVSPRGQGLVEFTLVFPVLLILLSGLMEFGFLLNEYLDVLDGAREASRFASDNTPLTEGGADIENFYVQAANLAEQTMAPIRIYEDANNNGICESGEAMRGDIVISVFSVSGGAVSDRHPKTLPAPSLNGQWRKCGTETSKFSNGDINARLEPLAPNTGIILIEIFFDYDQKFKLPWITPFIPDPIKVHTYTIMPLVAAEPTPTPIP